MLRRIFGPKRDEVTGNWRKLHNEELNDLYCSPNIVRVIKSRKIRWAGYVARMDEKKRRIQGFGGEPREKETTWETQSSHYTDRAVAVPTNPSMKSHT